MKQEAKPPLGDGNFLVRVPEEGLELSLLCGNKILSLASLPMSPFARDVEVTAVTNLFIFNP